MRLSIAIPVYNFAAFIPETLASILEQEQSGDVEIVVTDGASTDETPELMAALCAKHSNLVYNRLPAKGGIDKDMALAVAATFGDYVWLFGGDDLMHDGAISFMLGQIETGDDIYLCRHTECTKWMQKLLDYPILETDEPRVFDLGDPSSRRFYFSQARNSEAFFSFCGGLVIRRATWDSVPFDRRYHGSCWAHAARLFAAISDKFTVNYVGRPLLDRRADNDSFSHKGLVERYRIQVDGFHDIMDDRFGRRSYEAKEMRRAIRNEFPLTMVLTLKYLCFLRPSLESKTVLDRIVARAYQDLSVDCLLTRLKYKLMPAWMIWRRYEIFCWPYRYPDEHRRQQAISKLAYLAQCPVEKGQRATVEPKLKPLL